MLMILHTSSGGVQKTHGDEPNLAIVFPIVFNGQRRAAQHVRCLRHIQASDLERLRAFRFVELNPHN